LVAPPPYRRGEEPPLLPHFSKLRDISRLRREVKTLREERAILAKAAAWFARETGKIPPGSTNS
jgi:transposase